MRSAIFVLGLVSTLAASAADLAGSYVVQGRNASGRDYNGTLEISRQGGLYRFDWNTGTPTTGIAVVDGNSVSVAYGGPQCGVVSYEVGSDGALDGVWALSTDTRPGTEVATPLASSPNGTVDYSVTGSGANGQPYRGSLRVVPQGDRLAFSWRTGNESAGFGVPLEGHIAVVYGGGDCGVATYTIGNRGLEGIWATGRSGIGSETATRNAGLR